MCRQWPSEWPGFSHTVTGSTLDLQDSYNRVHRIQGLVQFQLSTFFHRLVCWVYYTQLRSQLLEFWQGSDDGEPSLILALILNFTIERLESSLIWVFCPFSTQCVFLNTHQELERDRSGSIVSMTLWSWYLIIQILKGSYQRLVIIKITFKSHSLSLLIIISSHVLNFATVSN